MLFCLAMILIVVMACITVSIAVKTRERLEQQTLADTIAYSNAVASARAYNTLSLINRTAVSHWVSLMAVQANLAWGSLHKAWFESLADALDQMEPAGPPQNACAATRQQELKHARHSLLHAALSSYNGANASDDVHLGREHPTGCSLFDERSANRWVRNFGEDDARVANESRKIYGAIMDLNDIQDEVYAELEDRVKGGELATALVRLARGAPSLGPYRLLTGAPSGDGPAWERVSNALGRGVPDAVRQSSLVPFAHAAMGSRPSNYLVGGSDQRNPPPGSHRVKPPWTMDTMQAIEDDLNQHFGGNRFDFTVEHFAVRTYLGDVPDDLPSAGRVHPGRELGFANVGGGAWARIRVEYRGPCGTMHRRLVYPVAESMLNRVDSSRHEFGHLQAGEGRFTGPHQSRYGNACHADHRHWGEINADNHWLQGGNSESIWPRGYGFVFPQRPSDERNFPVFGQPVMPVLLARSYRPADAPPDPWNLTFRMQFSATGAGQSIDLGKGAVSPDQLSIATAILYYHRRRPDRAGARDADRVGETGWRESPNLLNPYWHATLVRSDLGERPTPTRSRTLPPRQRVEHQLLEAEGFTRAAEAYRELERAGFKSWQ